MPSLRMAFQGYVVRDSTKAAANGEDVLTRLRKIIDWSRDRMTQRCPNVDASGRWTGVTDDFLAWHRDCCLLEASDTTALFKTVPYPGGRR